MDPQQVGVLLNSAAIARDGAAAAIHMVPLLLQRLVGARSTLAAAASGLSGANSGGSDEQHQQQKEELCRHQDVVGGLLQLLFASAVWEDEQVLQLLLPVVAKVMEVGGKDTKVSAGCDMGGWWVLGTGVLCCMPLGSLDEVLWH
jgi:hypothetical protein